MNTGRSSVIGWFAFTGAFLSGGYYGFHQAVNSEADKVLKKMDETKNHTNEGIWKSYSEGKYKTGADVSTFDENYKGPLILGKRMSLAEFHESLRGK